jgi:hypothetical protein
VNSLGESGERDALVRRFQWNSLDSGRIEQLQMYWVVGDRGYTATATTPYESRSRLDVELYQLLSGIVMTGPSVVT